MYKILSETLIPTCPQKNDTNVMSLNDKGVTFVIEQKHIFKRSRNVNGEATHQK